MTAVRSPMQETAKAKPIALDEVVASARVLSSFADAIVANPRVFRKTAYRGKADSSSKVVDPQILERLRRKLQAAEEALGHVPSTAQPKVTAKRGRPAQQGAALATLREEARAGQKKLVADGTLVEASKFLQEWGFSKQALSKAQAANRVFSLDIEGERYYPAFFLDPRYDRAKLEKVSKVLGDLPAASKLHFFLGGRGSLAGKTPLEALAAGQLDKVMNSAQGFAQG